MNQLYPQDPANYLGVLFIFLRLLGLFLLVPGFSHQTIPNTIKVGLALSLSLALYPMLSPLLPHVPTSVGEMTLMALRESAIGFIMGFAGYLTFEGISLGAQFVGYQMGFGTAGVIDPQNQAQVSILVPLHGWLLLMMFFLTDMHHNLLKLFVLSFEVTRQFLGADLVITQALFQTFMTLTTKLFVLAIQMAAPFTLLILCCNVAVGVLSRLLPQMNIILFSFPITILLGFCGLYVLAPDLLSHFELVLQGMTDDVVSVLKTI
jgi:flagellar biosynthesis protein FliR